jgi:hypothetical protein
MHSAMPSCHPKKMRFYEIDGRNKRTFVKTAIDAYELPKLIPTMEGTAETSIGASAVPFGMNPLGAMVYGGFQRV